MLFDRRSLITIAALAVTAPIGLALGGPRWACAYVVLWAVALPWVVAPLRALARRELIGVLFVLFTAASADYLDAILGVEQRISLALVLLSFGYLASRGAELGAVARAPSFVLLAIFFTQQAVSAVVLNRDELWPILANRIGVLATVLAGAVLTRREDGRRGLAALSVLGALMSVPVMIFEVLRPEFSLFSWTTAAEAERAGGLFAQANNVGSALSFAVAFLLALRSRGELARGAAVVAGVIGVGLIACASRGALLVVVALVGVAAWSAAWRRAGRAPIAAAALVASLLALAMPPLGRGVARYVQRHDDGSEQVSRLAEVVLAISGSPDELAEDDSSRGRLARDALVLIAERPLTGRGTRNFFVETWRRSHVQFLEVLGENGVVGGLFYLALLAALIAHVWRAPPVERAGGALVLGAWLLTNFDNHDVLEYRFMVLPLAYVCGLPRPIPRAELEPSAEPEPIRPASSA